MLLTVESEIKFTQDTAFHLTTEDHKNINSIFTNQDIEDICLFARINKDKFIIVNNDLLIKMNYYLTNIYCSSHLNDGCILYGNGKSIYSIMSVEPLSIEEIRKLLKLKAFL